MTDMAQSSTLSLLQSGVSKMKEKFINKRFSSKCHKTIEKANKAVKDYSRFGVLELKQLFDVLVMRGDIDEGRKSYRRLQWLLHKAIQYGLFDKENIAGRYHGTIQKNNIYKKAIKR